MNKKELYFDAEAFIWEGEAEAKRTTPNETAREIVRAFAHAINGAYARGYEDGINAAARMDEYMNGPDVMARAERENGMEPDEDARRITALFVAEINMGYQCGYEDGAADREGGDHGRI